MVREFRLPRRGHRGRVTGPTDDLQGPQLVSFIDVYWCDASGMFLQGWALVGGVAPERITVRAGEREVAATRSAREDLRTFFPAAVDTGCAGFSVYLSGRPAADIRLVALLADGHEVSQTIDLPDHPLPVLTEEPPVLPPTLESFARGLLDGPILLVGARCASAEILRERRAGLGSREVVGFDIHPGIGVDVVGDAHRLASYFASGTFAGIQTASLLEHLAMPWLFAAQCASVLMPGGRMLHRAPWSWPTHAQPNDFWRMSGAGLRSLFTEQLGYRTVACGETGAARLIPDPTSRQSHPLMATTSSALEAWIEVEKIDDRAATAQWPYDEAAGAQLAAEYPVDGLADV
jgi:hypothetical protein